ncbi:tryptophan 2,3-dioxygenase [Nocardiopsis coralliicola]
MAPRTAAEPAPYTRYGEIDTLHALQHPRTDEPAERTFILTTQVMELLFALIADHWQAARDALEDDDVPAALAALRQGARVQDVLVQSWDLLADLTPAEFERFRPALGDASGIQSAAYRRLEYLLGNTAPGLAAPHRGDPAARAALERALAEPGLYDAVLRLLSRRGLPVPAGVLGRDRARPYRPDMAVEEVWRRVYADERAGNDLLQLAEALLDTAERVTRWRHRHLWAVRRSLGARPGTGGTEGVRWLARNAEREVFPELWTLRTRW